MYDFVVIGNPTFHLQKDGPQLSGSSIYSAATAVKLGIENIAVVGSIDFTLTEVFTHSLDTLGVPEYYIVADDESRTREVHYTNEDGQSIKFLGNPHEIRIRDIPHEFLQARAILLCPSLQEINSELVEWICNSSDSLVYLKPNLQTINSDGFLDVVKELNLMEKTHSFLDTIQPNEQEALLITGESDPYLAAELLVEWAAETCIITLGERGSLIYDGNDFHIIPPFDSNPVDKSGAGSVYLTAFASQQLVGKTLYECGAFGSSLASVKVEHAGLDFEIDQNEIKKRYDIISESIEVR